MTSFATELAMPNIMDERTLRVNTLPRLIYKDVCTISKYCQLFTKI